MLPIGVDASALSASLPAGSWECVPLTDAARVAQGQVREFVPGFVAALPGTSGRNGTLADLLADGDRNLWWFLEIAEKSPMRGPLINRLYYLALIRTVLRRDPVKEVWIDLDDGPLASVLCRGLAHRIVRVHTGPTRENSAAHAVGRYLIYAMGSWILHVARLALLRVLRTGGRGATDGSVVFFSFFPAWWNHAHEVIRAERFFGDLPRAIATRVPTQFAVWLSAGVRELWRHRAGLRRWFASGAAIPLQAFVGIAQSLEVLAPRHLVRLLRFRFGFASDVSAEFVGFPIGPFVRAEILRSMTGAEFFMDLLLSRAVGRLLAVSQLRALVYRVEFQPFERAILAGVRSRIPTVGFQHSTFGRNYLPYFFDPGGLSLDAGTVPRDRMPLPDVFMATGNYPRDVMIANGFPPDRIEVCGPVRYAKLLAFRRTRPPGSAIRVDLDLPRNAPIFVVAGSVSRGESVALLTTLRDALTRLSRRPYVVFKSHPALPLDAAFARMVEGVVARDGYRILHPDTPVHEYIAAADGVVLTGTTVGLEAIVLGVIPIVFESAAVFDAKSMQEIAQACFVVHDGDEMARAMTAVIEDDPQVVHRREHWPSAIALMFDRIDLDPIDRFTQVLMKRELI